jgi:hypothetical protein
MTGALQHVDDDSGERCVHCGAQAAGPCGSCRAPVCGDCTTLTEGGVKVWAICLACDRVKGRRLHGAWRGLLLWALLFLTGLALVTWVAGRLLG